jgi:hypothetical protein
VRQLQPLIKRVEAEIGEGAQKQQILRELTLREGAFIAFSMCVGLPKQIQRRLVERIGRATPEQLIEFRQRAMASKLKDRSPLLLTAWCTEEGGP